MTALEKLIAAAHRPHYYVDEDPWYSCPLAPGGCANESVPAGVCNCGADAHNAEVGRLGALLRAEIRAYRRDTIAACTPTPDRFR